MAGRFTVESVFKAIDQITGPVRRMKAQIAGFSESAVHKLDAVNNTFGRMTDIIKTGTAAAAGGLLLLSAGMVQAKDVGKEFEQTLVNAAAKFPEQIARGTEEFTKLEDAARKIGSTTKFTASQAAQGLEFLAMAGFNAQQSISALPGVVDLASAANMDLARASDAATDILGAFNLTVKDGAQLGKNLARVNDVLAKTANSTNTSVAQLYEAVTQSGAAAAAAGTDIEQYSAMLGILANAGTKGSEAGNALKTVFTSLMAPTNSAAKTLKKLGVSVSDSKGNMRDTVKILSDFKKAISGMGNVQQMATINEIFGKDYVAPMSVLLRDIDLVKDLEKTLDGATGSASKMAQMMGATTKGLELTLSSAMEGNQISFFKAIQKPYEKFLETLIEVANATNVWINANKELIQSKAQSFLQGLVDTGRYFVDNWDLIAKTVKAVVTAFMSFYAVMAVMKAFITVMTLVNMVMAASPLTWIIVGIGLLVVALIGAIYWWDELKAAIADGWDQAIAPFVSMWDTAEKAFTDFTSKIPEQIDKAMNLAKELFFAAIDTMTIKAMELFDFSSGKIGQAFDWVGGKLGFSDESETQVVSPSERITKEIRESTTNSNATLTINDNTGKASLDSGNTGGTIKLNTTPSGAF